MNAEFKIETRGDGTASIQVNGVEIAHMVSEITYRHKGDGFPELNLTFISDEINIDAQGKVSIAHSVPLLKTRRS